MKARSADTVLQAQVRAVMESRDGLNALISVLEELGSQTLAAAALSGPVREISTPEDTRVQWKLFHCMLTVLKVKLSKGGKLPASMAVLRGVYASIVNAMQMIMGESVMSATHTAALLALYKDPASDEHADTNKTHKHDTVMESWVAAPDAPALASSAADAVPVEEV
mgnify:CR=1 FL=1